MRELEDVMVDTGVNLVEWYPLLSEQQVKSMIQDLKHNQEIEGFVLRFNNGQEMVKVKAEHFCILHALKSNLTTTKLVELWMSWDSPEWKQFEDRFISVYDWETWQWAMPVVSSVFDGIREVQQIINHVSKFVNDFDTDNRKEFALEAQNRFNQLRLSLCFLLFDKKPVPNELMKKLILQNSKQVERSIFSNGQ